MTTTMTLISDYETGTCTGHVHPHNGYYAGDFAHLSTTRTRAVVRTRSTAAHHTLQRLTLPRR